MKPILPSLKEKKRYIAYEILSEKPLKRDESIKGISNGILKFLGQLGNARAGTMVIESNQNKGILKVSNTMVDQVKTGLALIKEIEGNKVIVKTTKVSGTLSNIRKGGVI